jgi:hypothetical protein
LVLSSSTRHDWWFMQYVGVDFDDAFTPVARMESVRLLAQSH